MCCFPWGRFPKGPVSGPVGSRWAEGAGGPLSLPRHGSRPSQMRSSKWDTSEKHQVGAVPVLAPCLC